MSETLNNNEIVSPDTDDLAAFKDLFFNNRKEETVEEEIQEEVSENDAEEDNALAIENEDQVEDETETSEEDEDEDLAEDEEEEEVKKPRKNRAQERISELNGKFREQERRADDLQRKLDEVLAKLDGNKTTEKPVEVKENGEPQPTDLLEDGSEKYPLGEFDPQYIRDLTRFTLNQEREALKAQEEAARQQDEINRSQLQLATEWNGKLEEAIETKYPDMREKNAELQEAFVDLNPTYGDYLASTIMSMDYGTDVLYYLANNIDEAKRIAASGPAKATVALGRLEARFALQAEEQKDRKLKVSKAPTPPERLNKGSSVAKTIAPDTDDLAAFKELFFRR